MQLPQRESYSINSIRDVRTPIVLTHYDPRVARILKRTIEGCDADAIAGCLVVCPRVVGRLLSALHKIPERVLLPLDDCIAVKFKSGEDQLTAVGYIARYNESSMSIFIYSATIEPRSLLVTGPVVLPDENWRQITDQILQKYASSGLDTLVYDNAGLKDAEQKDVKLAGVLERLVGAYRGTADRRLVFFLPIVDCGIVLLNMPALFPRAKILVSGKRFSYLRVVAECLYKEPMPASIVPLSAAEYTATDCILLVDSLSRMLDIGQRLNVQMVSTVPLTGTYGKVLYVRGIPKHTLLEDMRALVEAIGPRHTIKMYDGDDVELPVKPKEMEETLPDVSAMFDRALAHYLKHARPSHVSIPQAVTLDDVICQLQEDIYESFSGLTLRGTRGAT